MSDLRCSDSMFRTLDQADVKGKRVLVRVDLNVPMENGKLTDATRIERAAPTIREIADKGGKVDPALAFRPAEGPRSEGLARSRSPPAIAERARPAGRLRRRLHRREGASGDRRDEARRHPLPGEHALPQGRGEERSRLRRAARRARRHLRQRRFLGGAPRACLGRRPGAQAAGLCRPHHAGRARGADQGAGDADRARWRRSSAAPRSRPSSTCSATCCRKSTCWSSAAAWPTPSWPR